MSWDERVRAFEERGISCIQSAIWKETVPFAYLSTEDATSTVFEIFDIPEGFVLPEPDEWYPAPPHRADQIPPLEKW